MQTFGLFVIYPAMSSQSARLRSPNAALLVRCVAHCWNASIPQRRSRFPGLPPRSLCRSISNQKPEVVAGPAGPSSCSSMRLQKPLCATRPRKLSRARVFALQSRSLAAYSQPGRSLVSPAVALPSGANAGLHQAGSHCSPGRPNPSVKGTSCGKPQAAPYVER